jgi:hypothetical protein
VLLCFSEHNKVATEPNLQLLEVKLYLRFSSAYDSVLKLGCELGGVE